VAGAAAVEVEDELVEVGLEMVAVQTVVNAQGLAFEVREHAGGPLRDEGSGHGADTMGMVVDLGGREIGGPSVGLERRTGGDMGRDESEDTFGGIVGNGGETASSAKRAGTPAANGESRLWQALRPKCSLYVPHRPTAPVTTFRITGGRG
jgi:hypothetical protein